MGRETRADALHRSSVGRNEESVYQKLDEALREDGAVVGHNIWINFHHPVRRTIAAVGAFLDGEARLRVGKRKVLMMFKCS